MCEASQSGHIGGQGMRTCSSFLSYNGGGGTDVLNKSAKLEGESGKLRKSESVKSS